MLHVDGLEIATNKEGFLKNQADWNENVAEVIARDLNLALTEAHWEIIRFIQDYYENFEHLPNARVFTRALKTTLGEEKGNTRYLYQLFPDGPLKTACRLAGLPKPTSCI